MKIIFLFALAGFILASCSNSGSKTQSSDQPDQNKIVITNDMENARGMIPGWQNEDHVIAMSTPAAHSGTYACISNDTTQYSYTFKEQLKNLNSKLPKSASVKGWVYTTVANPNFAILCSINQDQKLYDWKAVPLDKELTETGKWVEFTANYFFSKPLTPEDEIWIFAWNQSKKNVYLDDLTITFQY
jgi:hypothetical protein